MTDISTQSDLIDFFKLNAVYDPDTHSTREVIQTSDRTQFERRVTIVKEWSRSTKRLGRRCVVRAQPREGRVKSYKRNFQEHANKPPQDWLQTRVASFKSTFKDVFVDFHGWFENYDSVFLAMEYFELGDLEKFITPELTEDDAKMIGRQLFEGLEILHGYNWAHRDLKPGNIFVVRDAPQWWIKIGDFGISKRIRAEQSGMYSRVGTDDYMAPEMFWGYYNDTDDEEALPFTVAVDLWSLGCVLFRLLTRQLPFGSPSSLLRYYRSKVSFPTDALNQNNVSRDGIAILSELMKPQPADRMNVSAALLHSWTCDREFTQKGQLPPGHDFPSKIIGEIPTAELQLKAHTSDVGNNVNHELHSLNDSENEDTAVQSAGVKTTDNESNRLKTELSLNEQMVKTQMRELGNEHPITLQSMANLVIIYRRAGHHGSVVKLGEQTVKTQNRVLGAEHLDTLLSMYNLAISYHMQGQYEQAAQLGERTVEVRERLLGAEHPDTLLSEHNLASSYHPQGQYEQAAQLGEQTVEVRGRVLGVEHVDTLESMHNLATSLYSRGQYERAVELGEQTAEIRKRVLGAEHVDTLQSIENLAIYHLKLQKRQSLTRRWKRKMGL